MTGDGAVHAALRAVSYYCTHDLSAPDPDGNCRVCVAIAAVAVEAARPIIAASVLSDAADEVWETYPGHGAESVVRRHAASCFRAAARMESEYDPDVAATSRGGARKART